MGMISEDKLVDAFVTAFKDTIEPGLSSLSEKVEKIQKDVSKLTNDVSTLKEDVKEVKMRLGTIESRLNRQSMLQGRLQDDIEVMRAASL